MQIILFAWRKHVKREKKPSTHYFVKDAADWCFPFKAFKIYHMQFVVRLQVDLGTLHLPNGVFWVVQV